MAKLEGHWPEKEKHWRGFRLLAVDKTTLSLPEWPKLWKKFGCHKVRTHVGTIGVELCCMFSVISRAPVAFTFRKANSSEFKLIAKLFKCLKKGDLLLIDNGFYGFQLFKNLLSRMTHFIIPASSSIRPKMLRKLDAGDFLAEIKDTKTKETIMVRILYVYRSGFRRRRIVTSLLDPGKYQALELANLYHMRWTVETFYREFKSTMEANHWHCQCPDTFEM